jgi:uncharacterized protein (TIGR03790 family)
VFRAVLFLGIALLAGRGQAQALTPDSLAIIYDRDDAASGRIAHYYADRRHVPAVNLIGLSPPHRDSIDRFELARLRKEMLDRLPSAVQSLLLVWSRPYAVECMSVTTAFAAGYQPEFCEPGCATTTSSPLYDTSGWLPADTAGWWPAMLLPTADEALARAIVDRGIAADGTDPPGIVYLVRTDDGARNVRAASYAQIEALLGQRLIVRELRTPVSELPTDAIAYFTGVKDVAELAHIGFRPGAAADHLTSTGGVLYDGTQMSAVQWLRQGATASYGTVSEPCNFPQKFPNIAVFLVHYLRGDTVLEAYWKSVAMPGQGLFLGEPLARPWASKP